MILGYIITAVLMLMAWTADIVFFWTDQGFDPDDCFESVNGVKVLIYDELYLVRQGMKVSGVFVPPSLIEITTLGSQDLLERTKSLFRHELSHFLCYYVGGIPFEKHHELFSSVGLGA
jgi:hypothetical protein